ncbi:thioredoxin-related transmembrane protein 2 homolog [Megalopta genalis]|uniref:thioredoxin-related transmembrane protein 2 homolog n=1 Tax=Megalopta genalis TaxID=115081 RepID=UPI0014435813|nr:thioredoxin-related transmembrane protein 2 homolog [Megalopta genalis]XP_033339941.1 thioredoxin-related transmembrane protein 2 homolog [Megalopta genalis]
MAFKKDLQRLQQPYYLINILLSLSYIVSKRIPFICHYMFAQAECELDGRETEILFFLMIVIMIRSRKTGSVTMINYLSSSFAYTKVANLILWLYADIRMGILFAILFTLCGLVFPEPTYRGPEEIIYLRSTSGLQEELQRDTKVVWLVAFYTAWNPACVNFAPIFAELSAEYVLPNLKFGKVDLGRCPDAGSKYHISDASTSKQLPTLILFKEGREADRRPYADHKGKLVKFLFSLDNIKAAFDLNNLHYHCKNNPLKKKDRKSVKAE